MKLRTGIVAFCVLTVAVLAAGVSVCAGAHDDELALGEVEMFVALSEGNRPEGITFDQDGNLYFGNRSEVLGGLDSELRKVTPDGKETVIATFATSPGSALLGLVTDGDGNVWAAVDGGADHGVWKVSGTGKRKDLIDGSEGIGLPNALAFDARGNLYVTDSAGAIWRLSPGSPQTFEIWSEDEALAPLPFDPFGFPAPGANGVAFFPPSSLYVANTEKGQVIRIPILSNGSAGPADAVTALFAVPSVDGIAVDVHGDIHCALPGHALLGTPPLVKVEPDTATITRTTLPEFDGLFDTPLSLAFDTLPGERTNLFVTNGNLPVVFGGPGPGLARVEVGVKGLLLR